MFAQRDAGNKHGQEDEQERGREPLFGVWLQFLGSLDQINQEESDKGGAVAVAGRIGVAGLNDAAHEIKTEIIAQKERRRARVVEKDFAQEFQADTRKENC
mgnify:CR=1 FL=1